MNDRQSISQILSVIHRHKHIDIGLQRRYAFCVETHRIHTHIIKVGNLLIHSARLVFSLGDIREKIIQTHLVCFAQLVKCTITCKLRLQRISRLPATGSILIKVIIKSHALIEISTIDRRHILSLLYITSRHNCNG